MECVVGIQKREYMRDCTFFSYLIHRVRRCNVRKPLFGDRSLKSVKLSKGKRVQVVSTKSEFIIQS